MHPDAMAHVAATDKAEERAALAEVIAQLGLGLATATGAVRGGGDDEHTLFDRVVDAWADAEPEEAATGICLDITLIHVASMSNLFAALGWHLVDLLEHPDEAEAVRLGDTGLAETCALESTRMAQRSIMARFTLAPFTSTSKRVRSMFPSGMTVATLLPLTNRSAAPGLDRWDPARWNRRQAAHAERVGRRGARHGVRARWALLPGAPLLPGGHDADLAAPPEPVPLGAVLVRASRAGPRADRWRGPRRCTVSRPLLATLRAAVGPSARQRPRSTETRMHG